MDKRPLIVLGIIGLAVVGAVVVMPLLEGDEDYSRDPITAIDDDDEPDPIEGRTCEIFYDISRDAADGVDSYAETRARFKDLLEGYGQTVSPSLALPLRDIVSALTAIDTDALDSAVGRMSSACLAL